MNKFDFKYDEYQRYLERCPFTDEEKAILDMRRHGKSRTEMSAALHISDGVVDRRIASINEKIIKEI